MTLIANFYRPELTTYFPLQNVSLAITVKLKLLRPGSYCP